MKLRSLFNPCITNRAFMLLAIIMARVPQLTYSQTQPSTVSGRVALSNATDDAAGTSINVKGLLQGTTTDAKGQFSLSIKLPATLIISRVGYNTKEINVRNTTPLNITLSSGSGNLDEVVVVSYGTRKARDLTNAVANLNLSETRDVPGSQLGQKLQGKIPGLQVSQTNGRPGQPMNFRVRGAASLSSGFQPLVVVDGQPLVGADSRSGGMNLINPSDIESISVLKDASAAALYGSRAANGVVLITTKHAKLGSTQVSADVYTGWQTVPQRGRPDIMNAKEFATYMKGFYEDKIKYEGATNPVPDVYAIPDQYGAGTNWYDAILRTATMQNYSVNLSAGTEKVSSSTTLTYFNQDGVLLNTNVKRYSFRTNNEYRPVNWFKAGMNLAPSYQQDFNTTGVTDGNRQLIANATAASPIIPIYAADGRFNSRVSSTGMLGLNNPVQQLENLNAKQTTFRLLGNLYAEVEPIKNLRFKTTINTDLGSSEFNAFQGTMYGIGLGAAAIPRPTTSSAASHSSYNYVSWLNENTLNYSLKLDDHSLDILAGYSAQKWGRNYRTINGSNFAGDGIPWISGAAVTTGNTNREEWSLASFFGSVNYNFKDRYILNATIRQDGSSRFGVNNKYGTFPSVSAGWVASDESFFPKNNAISFLKFRGSYGKTGNFNIGNYVQVSNITSTNYVFGGSLTPGFSTTSLGNKNLTWEISTQADVGLDVNFWNDRITLNYDYYNKNTNGMLYPTSLPYGSGYGSVTLNVGKFRIWGHEFQLNSRNLTGAFEWETGLNISFNDNKVLELPPNTLFIGGGPTYSGYNRSVVGHRIGEFYGYVFDGVYMNQQEFDSQPKAATSVVGSVRMKDTDNDNDVDADDRTLIGNPNPKYIYGITNTFRYKNFDFNIICAGQGGNQIMNVARADLTNLDGIMNLSKDMLNTWRSEDNPGNGLVPSTRSGSTELYRLANTTWLSSGNFFTIKNIALGYTFKSNVLKYLQSARIYLSVQQAFVFTKYKGQNPEASVSQDDAISTVGQDLSTYPVPRTFMIGANINF
ncbi:TonB-linked outer membrane protein, SusC/RagA family [bacterium A37T11]|nr:TonB-linked outer membrane protein, SusC/RagA family [bacterium A37T11]